MVILDDQQVGPFQEVCQLVDPLSVVAPTRRVVGAGLKDQEVGIHGKAMGEGVRVEAAFNHLDRDQLGASQLEHVDGRGESGIFHEHPVSVVDRFDDDPVEGIESPVHHGQRLGLERPALPEHLGQCRQGGLIQVARDRWFVPECSQGRSQRRQQVRIRGTGAEVQPVGVRVDGYLPEAPRVLRLAAGPYEASAAALCCEKACMVEATP